MLGLRRARRREGGRDLHELGLGAAVGLRVGPTVAAIRRRERSVRRCGVCGAEGRIEVIDVNEGTAEMRCPGCGRAWTTDDMRVARFDA
jgi:predicted RNA-binding Zn-ribbon protein involved in translation (DUF1610 family)